ncbi:MAG: 5-formyltetrahydrofolate cyclo-ligase [Microscillaceae bacterium]|nr:5-formyltetrahydrofolate cyclo-ligase [Microscillaceae bacterium]
MVLRKSDLRNIYQTKRQQLQEAEAAEKSRQICARFFQQIDLDTVRKVHLFLPIRQKREIDTFLLVARLRQEYPEVEIVVPKSNFANQTLQHLLLNPQTELRENRWGIPEPVEGQEVSPQELDVVLVPLLAADRRGYRVGYGKGFYDKFLQDCPPEVLKIGLSFFAPIERIADPEAHDIRLDSLITDEAVYAFA